MTSRRCTERLETGLIERKERMKLIDWRGYRLLSIPRVGVVTILFVFLRFGAVTAFSQALYTVTNLRTPGGEISTAFAINNSGTVVGVSRTVPDDWSTNVPVAY